MDIFKALNIILMTMIGSIFPASVSADPPTIEWVTYNNGTEYGDDSAKKVTYDALGNVYVTGSTTDISDNTNITTIQYDAAGNQLWAASYDGHSLVDAASDLAVDINGNVYVSGHSWVTNYDNSEYVTIKYDAAGNQLWVATYDNGGQDAATALAVDSTGNVYVTGNSEGTVVGQDYTTIKYDSSGNQLWVAKYDDSESIADARDIAVDSGGNVYITGTESVYSNRDYTTIKYDGAGNQLWVTRYDNGDSQSNNDDAYALALDIQENIYVTGISSNGTDDDFATVKYDAITGYQLWVSRYNNQAADRASAIVVDGAGNAYVTGNSVNGVGGKDYATIKYDAATGNQLWTSRYDNGGDDSGQDIAVDNAGDVYVTGDSHDTYGYPDYATVKYGSDTGTELWVVRYDGGPSDNPTAVSVDTSGNVYVTGSSMDQDDISAYTTIKYNQDSSTMESTQQSTGPDLIMTAVNGPSSGTAGESIVIANTIKNQGGTAMAAGVQIGIYLSVDTNITTADTVIGLRRLLSTLAAGASDSENTTLTLPASLTPGTYYIGVIADDQGFYAEDDETNNTLAGNSIVIGAAAIADLVMTTVSGPHIGTAGESVVIANTIENQGGAAMAAGVQIGIYLSTDTNITTADTVIGLRRLFSTLAAGASDSENTTLILPASLTPGTYYIGVIADDQGFYAEGDETNNTLLGNTIAITIGEDLVMTTLNGPSSGTLGESITISDSVINQGVGSVLSSFRVDLFLSTDASISTSDLQVGIRTVAAGLAGGSSSSGNTLITLPNSLSPGTYYIGAIADSQNFIPEDNETNNALTGDSIVISPP